MKAGERGRQGNCQGEIYLSAGLLMHDRLHLVIQETHDTSKQLCKVDFFFPIFSRNLCQGPSRVMHRGREGSRGYKWEHEVKIATEVIKNTLVKSDLTVETGEGKIFFQEEKGKYREVKPEWKGRRADRQGKMSSALTWRNIRWREQGWEIDLCISS